MESKDLVRDDTFFDRTAFDELSRAAQQRRSNFMRRNPRAILALAGCVTLLTGGAGVIGASSRDATTPTSDIASLSYEAEARVNAATDQIEKFKSALQTAGAVSPEAATEIEQQIRQPVYDCNQTPCSAALQHRNYTVRAQLRALLAQKRVPREGHRAPTAHAGLLEE